MNLVNGITLIFISLFCLNSYAADRPAINFDGMVYNLAELEQDDRQIEGVYFPQNQYEETFERRIIRRVLLQVFDPKAAANGWLWELQGDNQDMPHSLEWDDKTQTAVLNCAYWLRLRPLFVDKMLIVFKKSPSGRVVSYEITYREFQQLESNTHEKLKNQGAALLFDKSLVEKAKQLDF